MTGMRNSAPDIFMTKRIQTSRARTLKETPLTGNNHLSVQLVVDLPHNQAQNQKKEEKWVPRKQRNNPRILQHAKEHYKAHHTHCMAETKRAQSQEQIKQVYNLYKQTILSPWKHTKKTKPCRLRNHWKKTLDIMAKLGKKLYRRATSLETNSAREAHKNLDKEIKTWSRQASRSKRII